MADFRVAGRQFRTQADYNAALRDQAQIEAIKAKVNMQQPGEVIALSEQLSSGKYRLTTMVGRDFKEEIQELADKYQKQGYTKESKVKPSKQQKKAQKQKKSGKSASAGSKTDRKAKTEKDTPTSLDQYDEQMQKEIKAVLKKNERRRKLIVILCGLVAIGCFGYYGVYYYFADKTQAQYHNLSDLKGSRALAAQQQGVTVHLTEDEEIELNVLDEYATLYNKNKRLIGWLKIEDTEIDYPVMQTTNNEYYLDHNYNQEYDKNGSLFLDAD
ncbi:MAG: class B sortase, partial [Lachnoclostridium sp.]|nr:class B sortase [Lachnoclostridium sp.]